MNCENCNTEVDREHRFCPACGRLVKRAALAVVYVRLPQDLRQALGAAAGAAGKSVNRFCVDVLAEAVQAETEPNPGP